MSDYWAIESSYPRKNAKSVIHPETINATKRGAFALLDKAIPNHHKLSQCFTAVKVTITKVAIQGEKQ